MKRFLKIIYFNDEVFYILFSCHKLINKKPSLTVLLLGTRLYIQLGDNANMVETVGEGRCELLAGMAKSAFTGDPLVPTIQNRGGVPEVFNEGMNE